MRFSDTLVSYFSLSASDKNKVLRRITNTIASMAELLSAVSPSQHYSTVQPHISARGMISVSHWGLTCSPLLLFL